MIKAEASHRFVLGSSPRCLKSQRKTLRLLLDYFCRFEHIKTPCPCNITLMCARLHSRVHFQRHRYEIRSWPRVASCSLHIFRLSKVSAAVVLTQITFCNNLFIDSRGSLKGCVWAGCKHLVKIPSPEILLSLLHE